MPNYNKPPAAPTQSPAQPEMAGKPEARPAALPPVRPVPPQPGILGARTPPPAKQPVAEKPRPIDSGPVLPLGAPRKKAPAPPQP
jgi:hypothetical protein